MNRPTTIGKAAPESDPEITGSGVASRRVTSETLFRGHRELRILHAGQEYRLFVTSKGRLILTK